jgi:hypothetical protein
VSTEIGQGTIRKFGIDIGFAKAAHVMWQVDSRDTDRGAGALGMGEHGSIPHVLLL